MTMKPSLAGCTRHNKDLQNLATLYWHEKITRKNSQPWWIWVRVISKSVKERMKKFMARSGWIYWYGTLTEKILNNKFWALAVLNLLPWAYGSDFNTWLVCLNETWYEKWPTLNNIEISARLSCSVKGEI